MNFLKKLQKLIVEITALEAPGGKLPTIKKVGRGWMYMDSDTILISSSKSDKQYMIHKIKEYRKKQKKNECI